MVSDSGHPEVIRSGIVPRVAVKWGFEKPSAPRTVAGMVSGNAVFHPSGNYLAICGVLRWGVMAQTADLTALTLIQPLHGFTFALLHLASMRLITDTVPSALAGTAQAVYGLVGVGGATAGLMVLSGWLYMHYGPTGFWVMALLCIVALPVIWILNRAVSARTR